MNDTYQILRDKYVYWCLLASLIAAFTITPILDVSSVSLNGFIILSVLLSICAVGETAGRALVALFLSVPLFVSLLIVPPAEDTSLVSLMYGSAVVFFGYVIFNLFKFIFKDTHVDTNRLLASICIYLCFAVVWCMLFGLVEVFVPASFDFTNSKSVQENVNELMYFSIVTLTTLGYGDLLPLSSAAKSIAAVEALVGQIYLTVLVARLVGLHAAKN